MSFEILLKTLLLGSSNLSELQKDVFAELKEFGIEINEEKLTNKVVVEQLGAAPEAFPHIYGCIDIAAVVNERALS